MTALTCCSHDSGSATSNKASIQPLENSGRYFTLPLTASNSGASAQLSAPPAASIAAQYPTHRAPSQRGTRAVRARQTAGHSARVLAAAREMFPDFRQPCDKPEPRESRIATIVMERRVRSEANVRLQFRRILQVTGTLRARRRRTGRISSSR